MAQPADACGDNFSRLVGFGSFIFYLQIAGKSYTMNKKGMEMWYLIALIIAILLLLFAVAWYSGLGDKLSDLLSKLGEL